MLPQGNENAVELFTNPEMTRFLMTLEESVELVEHAFLNANPGDLFVRKVLARFRAAPCHNSC
jgi:FlaA1/EpsC-like NDP-sugar epimerase